MNEQDILNLQQKILSSARTVLTGWTSGGAVGNTITVKLDSPSSGRNFVICAAWTSCPPGACAVVCDEKGNWYAISHSSSIKVRESVRHRQYRQRPILEEIYPFKFLISVFEDGVNEFCVGGDRSKPVAISIFNPSILYHCISNTGKDKNNWIVGLRDNLYTSGNPVTRCLGDSHTWELNSEEANSTAYKCHGFWASDLIRPSFVQTSTSV